MASIANYKCPACGGPLHFDSDLQKLKCEYCDSTYEPSEIEALYEKKETEGSKDVSHQNWSEDELKGMHAYSCPSCGAEIIVDENTAATSCPYCNNPTINATQFEGALRPNYIIPFRLKKEKAVSNLKKFYTDKPFLPKTFSDQNHIEEIKGLYVPFWLYDNLANADADYHTTKVSSYTEGDYEVTRTRHYEVHREGKIQFEKVPADAASKMPDEFMDAVEPFNYQEMVDFQKSYLTGYYADKYDVTASDNEKRINVRMQNSAVQYLTDSVSNYDSVVLEKENVNLAENNISYAFLPVWILATKWQNKNYLFVMNGQTGKMIGDDLPIDKTKMLLTFFLFAAVISVIAYFVIIVILG